MFLKLDDVECRLKQNEVKKLKSYEPCNNYVNGHRRAERIHKVKAIIDEVQKKYGVKLAIEWGTTSLYLVSAEDDGYEHATKMNLDNAKVRV
jgi:hypothetical protein